MQIEAEGLFRKSMVGLGTYGTFISMEPSIQRLARRGLVPELMFVVEHGKDHADLYMERIDGHDLKYYETHSDNSLRFSTTLAVGVAGLLQGIRDENLSHGDVYGRNIMYDEKKKRFVMVDNENNISARFSEPEDVESYSRTLTVLYLGSSIYTANYSHPDNLVRLLRGLRDKVDRRIIDFIGRGLYSKSVPKDFDEILALKE